MQQSGMNYLYTKVSAVREQLILFANQIESLDFEYNAVVAELEQSFTDSNGFWERTTAEQKDTASHNAGVALERLNEMANGLNLLDVQLSQVDQSYAKRRDALSMVVVPNITYQTADAFLSRMEAIAQEAKKIASECSLTVKAQLLQEFTMLFSSKRKQLYERLAELIVEGKAIRDKAYTAIQQNLTETKTQLDAKNETEIDNAATETADLLAALEQRHNEELASTIISYETTIERLLPRADIENLRVLSDSLHNQELLPNDCSEVICIGSYGAPLGDVAYNTYVVSLINRLYSGFIENQNLCLPAILDLSDKANFLLFDEGESMRVRNAVNSLIYSLLSNQPASHQKFILFDPEGRSQGFAPYLEFMRSNPAVMYNKVFTTQQQLRTQIEELSSFIDEFSQTKLADSPDIFAYNRISVERPESLKCLCLLNFPKGFDEQMLEQLYNIVKNGSSCGVQTFIHFDEGAIRNSSSTTYVDLLAKIRENCICLQAGSDGWHSDDGTSWAFNTAPSQKTMADFSELYGSKYAEVTSSILPITKIIPEDIWFTGDSSALFSVPIGKDENGTIQYLEFGDPVSKGTSHHALVTGSLGSGKSTLLHTIIMSALTTYSPDELNLYLLDFKSGTEFQVYANHKIPHIKVLALDAMQEFGQSVLDELVGMMQKRLDMFTEETQKGYPVKDITSYRKYTGKKMPRILVVADEFQVLFSEAHNRRVANTCATRLADIISLYRVCGIHFILATQTMSRLRNGFTVSTSTLSEMHVRIGLKCSESECNLLFGGTNAKAAFDKMGDTKGTAVYNENYVMEKPVGFKVAFCDTDTQSQMLETIEARYGFVEPASSTKVFVGETIPKLSECPGFSKFDSLEALSSVPIYLGDPIRIGQPVTLNVNRMKRSTLLVVGSEHRMSDQIMAVYMNNAIKSEPHKLALATEQSIYLFDGLSMMGEPFAEKVGSVVNRGAADIKLAKDVFDVLPLIDELYSIYEKRKQQRMSMGGRKAQYAAIHIVINDFQWIEPIVLMLNNKSVDDFVVTANTPEPSFSESGDDLFGFINKPHKNDLGGVMDSFLADLSPAKTTTSSNVSYHKKLMTLIESGYTCGFNVVMSCPDFISIKEIIYECIPKFQNRILFALSDKDADRIISEARVENLKSNIALYYDGVNPAYQFKPYDII